MTNEELLDLASLMDGPESPYLSPKVRSKLSALLRKLAPLRNDRLPPLPDYGINEWVGSWDKGESVTGFTEDQMYEYARAVEAAHGIKAD